MVCLPIIVRLDFIEEQVVRSLAAGCGRLGLLHSRLQRLAMQQDQTLLSSPTLLFL